MSMINKIVHRIEMMLAKAIVEQVVDTDAIQTLKLALLADETSDNIDRIQNYGMTSVPPKGSEAFVLFVNGNRDNGVAIAVDSSVNRPSSLSDNDVVIYSAHGQTINLKSNGSVDVGNGDDFVAMATKTIAKIEALYNAISTAATGTQDGGATFKTNILAALAEDGNWLSEIKSTNLKAD